MPWGTVWTLRVLLLILVIVLVVAGPTIFSPSAFAATCPNETLIAENNSSNLPDCRAYERVTPAFTEGQIIRFSSEQLNSIAPNGELVEGTGFGVLSGAPDDEQNSFVSGNPYQFHRTEDGWQTTPLVPPAAEFATAFSGHPRLTNDALTGTVVNLTRRATPGYRELYVVHSDGSLSLVGPSTAPNEARNEPESTEKVNLVDVSEDLSRVIFETAKGRWPGDTTEALRPSLYEYGPESHTTPRLVAVKNEGAVRNETAQLISQCGAFMPIKEQESHELSVDGEIVSFYVKPCSNNPGEPQVTEIYARVGERKTLSISEPELPPGEECEGLCAAAEPKPAVLEGATESGHQIFFTTNQPLLTEDKDSTKDLYEAEISGTGVHSEVARLIDLSNGGLGDATPGEGAEVLGIVRWAQDGSRVYFVAKGALTGVDSIAGRSPEISEPSAGQPNLYMVEPESGRVTFIATLSSEDSFDWERADTSFRQATPDGAYLAFSSSAELTPNESGREFWGIYRFDAADNSLVRVSAPQEDLPGSNGEDFPLLAHSGAISDIGQVVFATSAALTVGATDDPDHLLRNAYEYEEGHVYLIAAGSSLNYETSLESATGVLGISRSGNDIFVRTSAALIPSDGNTQTDLYDARVDGGFSQATRPTCEGEGCQGPSALSPAQPVIGSSTFSGPGNSPPTKHRKKRPKNHKTRKHKKSAESHRRKR